MIRNRKPVAAIVIFALFVSHAARAQTADQAKAFLRHLYGLYENPATPLGPDILSKHPLRVYTPYLYALVLRDQRRAGPGNVGNLDIDPICICQDNGGMKLERLDVVKTGSRTATATVLLSFPEPRSIRAQLFLLWTPNGWRVDEVKADDLPSLRKLLKLSSR
jgi:hypothetical protein